MNIKMILLLCIIIKLLKKIGILNDIVWVIYKIIIVIYSINYFYGVD